MLNGSVAVGTATELSDLDMIVLCNEIKFVSEVIDDVLVEIHYITYDKAIKRLNNYPMEVYKYLDAKIAYDNGKLKEIITCAENIFIIIVFRKRKKRDCLLVEQYKIKAEFCVFKAGYTFDFLSCFNKFMEGT